MADNRQQTDADRTIGGELDHAISGGAEDVRNHNDGTGLYPGGEDDASGGLRSSVLAQRGDEDDEEDLDEEEDLEDLDEEDEFDDEDEEQYED